MPTLIGPLSSAGAAAAGAAGAAPGAGAGGGVLQAVTLASARTATNEPVNVFLMIYLSPSQCLVEAMNLCRLPISGA
jgi:hypothetical protein